MSQLRSSPMFMYKLIVQKDNMHKSVQHLGDTSKVHFINLNEDTPSFKLPYTL